MVLAGYGWLVVADRVVCCFSCEVLVYGVSVGELFGSVGIIVAEASSSAWVGFFVSWVAGSAYGFMWWGVD